MAANQTLLALGPEKAACIDEHFQQFFRMEGANSDLDKLALLACSRQGIEVEELFFKPLDDFKEKGLPEPKVIMRFNMAEKRRQAKLKMVEEERELLLHQLFMKSARLSPAKQRELQAVAGEVRSHSPVAADGSRVSPDLVVSLLEASARIQSPRVEQPNGHLKDFDRIRNRELRQVEIQLWQELQQERHHQALMEKEKKCGQQAEEKRKLQMAAKERTHDEVEHKAAKVKEATEQMMEERRQRLERVERYRQERDMRRAQEEEILKQQRSEMLENKLRNVAERNKLVAQVAENRREMAAKDMEHKQQLYAERKKNIQLHQDTTKEVSKIRKLQKAIAIREALYQREEDEEAWKQQLLEKHHDAEERMKRHEMQNQAALEDKKQLMEAKERRRQELKALQDMRFQELINGVFQKHYHKEQHLMTRQQKLEQLQDLKMELKQLKLQNWMENRQRLSRAEEYREKVTQAKIEADRQRAEELLAKRQKEHEARMNFKLSTQLEKEALLQELNALRTCADPHILLNKTGVLEHLGMNSGGLSTSPRSPLSSEMLRAALQEATGSTCDLHSVSSHMSSANGETHQKPRAASHPPVRSLRQELRSDINRRVGDNVMYLLNPPLVTPSPLHDDDAEQSGTKQRGTIRGNIPPGSVPGGQLQGGAVHGSPVKQLPATIAAPCHHMDSSPPRGTGHRIPPEEAPYELYLRPQSRTKMKTLLRSAANNAKGPPQDDPSKDSIPC